MKLLRFAVIFAGFLNLAFAVSVSANNDSGTIAPPPPPNLSSQTPFYINPQIFQKLDKQQTSQQDLQEQKTKEKQNKNILMINFGHTLAYTNYTCDICVSNNQSFITQINASFIGLEYRRLFDLGISDDTFHLFDFFYLGFAYNKFISANSKTIFMYQKYKYSGSGSIFDLIIGELSGNEHFNFGYDAGLSFYNFSELYPESMIVDISRPAGVTANLYFMYSFDKNKDAFLGIRANTLTQSRDVKDSIYKDLTIGKVEHAIVTGYFGVSYRF